MLERFDRLDRRFVILCVLAAIVFGGIAWRYFGRAFPEASIQFAVNRSQSEDVAHAFLQRIGDDAVDYKHAAIFDFDEPTKTYLERQLGLERAQEVYGRHVRLWRWSHRWFRPNEKQEIAVDVTAAGEIARYAHLLAEDEPGPTLAPDSARVLAERFLMQTMQVSLDSLEFIETSASQRPQRIDHKFTWKRRGLDLGSPDATYRTEVEVAGDRVVGYDEKLDIPQAWQDDYARLRARNDLAALIATVFLVFTVVAMIGVLVLRVRDRDVRWKIVLAFGIVAAALQLLTVLNQFDLEKFSYQTQDGYASFVTQFLLQAILGAIAGGGLIVLFTGAAEPIYRERHPDHLALASYFTWPGLRTKTFFKQLLLGITLMFFFAAYQAIFYLVAARFGAWAPLEVPFSNLLNTAIPWAVVLFIGFFPAVSEEFLSRMFSLPFLGKHLPRIGLRGRAATVVAVLAASFIWGFAHSNYPNQPYWIRGVEVGLAGVLVSVVMLRWGIFAALVWHYTVDAFYTSLLMLRSGNPYFILSGAIPAGIMLVPLVVAAVLYVRRGGFLPATGLRNGDLTSMVAAQPAPAVESYAPESLDVHAIESGDDVPTSRRTVAGAGIVGLAMLLLFLVPVNRPGDDIRLQTDRATALERGKSQLRQFGQDPERWTLAMQLASRYDPQVARYVIEQTSVERFDALYDEHLRTPVWRLRWFRPDEREEWVFNLPVTSDSTLWAFEHTEPDSTRGEAVSMEMAQAIAGDYLRTRGLDPAALELKESSAEQQPARIDHSFEWEVPDTTLADAGIRYRVLTHGGKVAGARPYVHLPEAWVRAWESKSVLQRILWFASRSMVGLVVFALVAVFVQQVRARRIRWRAGVMVGLAVGVVSAIMTALRWQSDVLWTYETTTPYQLFKTGAGLSLLLQFVLTAAIAAVLAATAFAVRPRAAALFRGGYDAGFVRSAVLPAIAAVLLQIGLVRVTAIVASMVPAFAVPSDLLVLEAAARPLPWLDVFASWVRYLLIALPVVVIALHAAEKYFGRRRTLELLGVAAVLFGADGARSFGEFALQASLALLGAAVAAFVVLRLLRGNELAWVLALVLGRIVATVPRWLEHPAGRSTGFVLLFLGLALVVAIYTLAARRSVDGGSRDAFRRS